MSEARARVTLLDYGVGNLRSVRRALEAAGAEVDQSADVGGEAILLPGVGAFGAALERLGPGRVDELRAWSREGRPLLGICLGMQLLFEESHEHGVHRGLGLIPGVVEPLPTTVVVPHMGWATLSGLGDPTVYFCHSFAARPVPQTSATVEHGVTITAAVEQGRTWGFQFHPEKSGPAGIALLRRFIEVAVRARA